MSLPVSIVYSSLHTKGRFPPICATLPYLSYTNTFLKNIYKRKQKTTSMTDEDATNTSVIGLYTRNRSVTHAF